MKRYEGSVGKEEKGVTFDALEETSKESTIGNLSIDKAKASSENYANPPIPKGYMYAFGEWYNGLVIERLSDSSRFTWVPVGMLEANGTLDGNSYNAKFGRRNYGKNEFSENRFHELLTADLMWKIGISNKRGGFYISSCAISKNKFTGNPQSIKGEYPWTNIDFNNAKKIASIMETGRNLRSTLILGAEYDTVLEWFMQSEARTREEVTVNSSNWGNYWDTDKAPQKVVKTGSIEDGCTNNIYGFAGNVDKWTDEQCGILNRVTRGGNYFVSGRNYPASMRNIANPYYKSDKTGFYCTLWVM